MEDNEQMKPEDPDEQEASVLPAREAMSLIAPDPTTPQFIPEVGEESSENQSTPASNQDTASS
jgi:hypothetical protein